MAKSNGRDLFQGNKWSKFLFFLSFIFLCLSGVTLISKIETYVPVSKRIVSSETPWKIAILWFALSLVTGYIAYRLAEGRQNPTIWEGIWEGKELYDLLKNAVMLGQAKIGFHSLRHQKLLLAKLKSIGIKKGVFEDTRQFIRDKIVTNPRAFDILRDHILIQMNHKGKVWFWDGCGNKKTAQYFHEAEIIFDLESSLDYMFAEVLEGLRAENSEVT